MNFVDCESCASWDQETKFKHKCSVCGGKGFIQDPAEILCNYCGGPMHPQPPDNNWQTPDGLINAKVSGNYSTKYLNDETTYVFSFCECCLRDFFNTCKIPPKVYEDDVEVNYAQDRYNHEYNLWVSHGGQTQAYVVGKCNTIKDCPNQATYTILYGGENFSEKCCCNEHMSTYSIYSWYKLVPFIPNHLKAFI